MVLVVGGRASDSKLRGSGFNPHFECRVVSLSKTHKHPTVLVNAQEEVVLSPTNS